MLAVYDANLVLLVDPFRTFHDGHIGGTMEQKIYIRNADATRYYTVVTVAPQMDNGMDWGEFGDTGWGIKLVAGERQPTEQEWDQVHSSDTLQLADIGAVATPDTSYKPVWVRVACPGGTPAQIRENIRLRVSALERIV